MILVVNVILHAIHIGVILINVLGWIPRGTRVVQRWTIGLTLVSWLGLSPWYGLGYCFLTEWHWRVMRAQGRTGLPGSYTELLLETLTGRDVSAESVAVLTAVGLAFGVAGCIAISVRARRRRRRYEGSR